MEWAEPKALHLLWLAPFFAALVVRARMQRKRLLERFAEPGMLERLKLRIPKSAFDWRPWLALVGVILAIVAVARPRFGEALEQVEQQGLDLFVALDVSKSMLAEDVAPSRLERAKLDIQDVLNRLGGDRAGLIAFAGNAIVRMPLTNDFDFFREVLRDLGPKDVPVGGTAIGDAIRKAIESFEDKTDRDRVILLITDGDDQDSYPIDAAKAAAEKHIKIFAVGLGDAIEGARVPDNDEAGGFVKQDGKEVWSKMDEKLLTEIAQLTGGQYVPAKTRAYDLGQLLADNFAGLQRSDYRSETRKIKREQYQLFLAAALGCLLLSGLPRDVLSRMRPSPNGVVNPGISEKS